MATCAFHLCLLFNAHKVRAMTPSIICRHLLFCIFWAILSPLQLLSSHMCKYDVCFKRPLVTGSHGPITVLQHCSKPNSARFQVALYHCLLKASSATLKCCFSLRWLQHSYWFGVHVESELHDACFQHRPNYNVGAINTQPIPTVFFALEDVKMGGSLFILQKPGWWGQEDSGAGKEYLLPGRRSLDILPPQFSRTSDTSCLAAAYWGQR